MTLEMPDFIGFAIRTFLRGSNPPLPTNKGLQETADPFVLLGNTRVYNITVIRGYRQWNIPGLLRKSSNTSCSACVNALTTFLVPVYLRLSSFIALVHGLFLITPSRIATLSIMERTTFMLYSNMY